MSVKLLVLDLDGTLLNNEKKISQKNQEVLLEAQAKGLRIAIATGRMIPFAEKVVEPLELSTHQGFILGNNGQMIMDYSQQKMLTGSRISKEASRIAARFAYARGMDGIGIHKDHRYQLTKEYEQILFMDEEHHPAELLDKIVLFPTGSDEEVNQLVDDLNRDLGGLADGFLSGKGVLDLVSHGINKASGVDKVCRIMRIENNEVLAMGDGDNDLTLARFFPFVAMANAMPRVLAASDRVTLSNEEDGVAYEVQRSFLDCLK